MWRVGVANTNLPVSSAPARPPRRFGLQRPDLEEKQLVLTALDQAGGLRTSSFKLGLDAQSGGRKQGLAG